MIGRKRKKSRWGWDIALRQTVACLSSSIETLDARAAVVMHVDRDVVPEEWVRTQDLPLYTVSCYDYSHASDHFGIATERDRQRLMRERVGAASLDKAENIAGKWIGSDVTDRPFREIPGIFQAAYHDWLTAQAWDMDPTTNLWIVSIDGVPQHYGAREFPPPRTPTSLTPNPREATMFALPKPSADQLFKSRGW